MRKSKMEKMMEFMHILKNKTMPRDYRIALISAFRADGLISKEEAERLKAEYIE